MEDVLRLGEILHSKLQGIELIPGDGKEWLASIPNNHHAPFLLVDENLGVPEKVLYKLYILAAKALDVIRVDQDIHTSHKAAELSKITAVILAANPGHQAALNVRKRLILDASADAKAELDFIEILLMVKPSAKVSMLWHHRRWLLQRQYGPKQVSGTNGSDEQFTIVAFPVDVIRKEFSITSLAATVYPRNYHGWLHRTLCMQSGLKQATHDVQYLNLLMEEKATAMKWIDLHVSDYSAIHYLIRLCVGLHNLDHLQQDVKVQLTKEVRNHAEDLVRRYPTHESLWLYIRLVDDLVPTDHESTEATAFDAKIIFRLENAAASKDTTGDNASYMLLAARHLAWRSCRNRILNIEGSIVREIIAGNAEIVHKLCDTKCSSTTLAI